MANTNNSQSNDTLSSNLKPWIGDKLNRESEGKWLCDYLINKFTITTAGHSDNFVLSINADWGFGKTYFLNNLSLELAGRKHKVVYFDAWKNDFSDKPMLGFISEINDALSSFLKEDESKSRTVSEGFIDKLSKLKNSAAPLWLVF
ncbi:P-loop NTPase fold protein [Thalassotalea piscium]